MEAQNNELKKTIIRPAKRSDIPALYALVAELAKYENASHELWQTESQYFVDFDDGIFKALVADHDGQVIGTAIYYEAYSTWKGKMFHLEDFVVSESERRSGVGKKLFEAFIAESKLNGAKLVRWFVLEWNEPAINFYKKYESIFDEEWTQVKILFN